MNFIGYHLDSQKDLKIHKVKNVKRKIKAKNDEDPILGEPLIQTFFTLEVLRRFL